MAEAITRRTGSRAASADGVIHLPARLGSDADPVVRGLLAHEMVHEHARRRSDGEEVLDSGTEETFARQVEEAVRSGALPGPRLRPGPAAGTGTVPSPSEVPPSAAALPRVGTPAPSALRTAPEAPPLPVPAATDPGGDRTDPTRRPLADLLGDEALLVRERTGRLTDLIWR